MTGAQRAAWQAAYDQAYYTTITAHGGASVAELAEIKATLAAISGVTSALEADGLIAGTSVALADLMERQL